MTSATTKPVSSKARLATTVGIPMFERLARVSAPRNVRGPDAPHPFPSQLVSGRLHTDIRRRLGDQPTDELRRTDSEGARSRPELSECGSGKANGDGPGHLPAHVLRVRHLHHWVNRRVLAPLGPRPKLPTAPTTAGVLPPSNADLCTGITGEAPSRLLGGTEAHREPQQTFTGPTNHTPSRCTGAGRAQQRKRP